MAALAASMTRLSKLAHRGAILEKARGSFRFDCGVYNHYEYDAEKRAALELWADALNGIVGRGPSEIDGYNARLSRLKGIDKIKLR